MTMTQSKPRRRDAGYGTTGAQTLPLYSLQTQHSLYYNVDKRQRKSNVWGVTKRKKFIDTLLRGEKFMKLSPIVFNIVWEPQPDGSRKMLYYIEDGLQRLTAIDLFLSNQLRTFDRQAYRNNVLIKGLEDPPFGKLFNQLTPEEKQEFLNYPLPILVTEEASKEIADERYRRRNEQDAHTRGEKLRSYYGTEPTLIAERLSQHALWAPLTDNTRRKQRSFLDEMGLYIIFLHLYGHPLAQINKQVLEVLASGRDWDSHASVTIERDILHQLDQMAYLCHGITVTAKTDAIALQQAYWYLREATCDFERSQEGCLKSWFDVAKFSIIEEDKKSASFANRQGNLNQYAGLANQTRQLKFWRTQKVQLLHQPGLVFTDIEKMHQVRDGRAVAVPDVRVPVGQDSLVQTQRDREEAQQR